MNDHQRIIRLFEQSLPLFNALGDPIRQQLLILMMDGSRKSVAELTSHTALSRPTISHHLKILKDAHLIRSQKEGTKVFYVPQGGKYYEQIKELVNLVEKIEASKGNEG